MVREVINEEVEEEEEAEVEVEEEEEEGGVKSALCPPSHHLTTAPLPPSSTAHRSQ